MSVSVARVRGGYALQGSASRIQEHRASKPLEDNSL